MVGDSLSAGYGIPQDQGWVALLQDKLKHEAFNYHVTNASITGDTTRGGLSRLNKALNRTEAKLVIIALGGNDGLRGMSMKKMHENLKKMVTQSREHGAKVLLLGVMIPHNYGKTYREKFHQVYLDLAEEEKVALVPFFLKNVAETPTLMQRDGIHPSSKAQPIILENVWNGLAPLLE